MIAIRPAGDAALLVHLTTPADEDDPGGNGAARLAAVIRAAALPGVIDIVPGAATVLVSYGPDDWDAAGLASRLRVLASGPAPALPAGQQPDLVIPVVYDGPDLAEVAAITGLSDTDVIARHAAARYRVGWLGFTPGFGYLTGLDPVLATVPRRPSPRVSVPAGSVAIAGGLAAVYPAASPGGWQLLGRTSRALWDPGRDPSALLSPGRGVRFRIVDRLPPMPAAAPVRQRQLPNRGIEVLQPGPLTTVQDLGRPGAAHLGVPRSGAADPPSLRRANRLAGNPDDAAGLEVTLGRLTVRFSDASVIAVSGAPVPLGLTESEPAARGELAAATAPAGTSQPSADTAFAVPAGSVLRIGAPSAGLRSYLAVAGGIDTRPEFGSRSADRLSGLGPAPLRAGDWLPVGRARSVLMESPAEPPRTYPPARGADPVQLRVIAGPRDDWFSRAALTTLATENYEVTPASDRTGLRLAGPALTRSPGHPGELPSEGVAAGSLQITHDGQPILLLADHPTTGGYPIIAVVVSADVGLAAQLRPGQRVRFAVSRLVLA